MGMHVGIPKEIKPQEFRVGATPSLVSHLTAAGHRVTIQTHAGQKIGFTDSMYREAGAEIVPNLESAWEAECILKVKEPQRSEYPLMRKGQILFCFLHLAADPELLKHLIERKVIGIAFETVADRDGKLPILAPMSAIAGRMAVTAGAVALQIGSGGKGILLGGIPGVLPAKVAVIGGGIVGTEAAQMALDLGAEATLLDTRLTRLHELNSRFGNQLKTLASSPQALEETLRESDLAIGAVLIPGKKTPRLITEEMIRSMEPGGVFVDVSIDQGGCSETSRPTTLAEPTYCVHHIVHYCVANMPGGCARSASFALSNVVSPYMSELTDKGFPKALQDNPGLKSGLNVCLGHVTHAGVAEDGGYEHVLTEEFF